MKKYLFSLLIGITFIMAYSQSASALPGALPSRYGLNEGDLVSVNSSTDPDVFIVNSSGYKRLFLNPIIFSFYGHLGGFENVKKVSTTARDQFETSVLFRNCEINDPRVWALKTTSEDGATLHHIDVSGEVAVEQDSSFFRKIFCINNNEFNWYKKGEAYTSLSQILLYDRRFGLISQNIPCKAFEITPPKLNSNNDDKVTFNIDSAYCEKGISIEVASNFNFRPDSTIAVVYIFSTGEQNITATLCGTRRSDSATTCLSYQPGQELYYRIVDIETDTFPWVASDNRPFNAPYSIPAEGILTYTHTNPDVKFSIEFPDNFCWSPYIHTNEVIVIHNNKSVCGQPTASANNFLVIAPAAWFADDLTSNDDLIEWLTTNTSAQITNERRFIDGYEAVRVLDNQNQESGWAFLTDKFIYKFDLYYMRYMILISSKWDSSVPNAESVEKMILDSFTLY